MIYKGSRHCGAVQFEVEFIIEGFDGKNWEQHAATNLRRGSL